MPGKIYKIYLCNTRDVFKMLPFTEDLELQLTNEIGSKFCDWDGNIEIDHKCQNISYKVKIKKKHINDMTAIILTRYCG